MKIFYLIPTICWAKFKGETFKKYFNRLLTGNRQPSGGVQIIYQHCDILNRNGFSAFPVNIGSNINSFHTDWFVSNTLPISLKKSLNLIEKEDVIVCPEVIPEAIKNFSSQHKILFVQNHGLFKKRYLNQFTNILTVSPFCEEFIKKKTTIPVSVVINGINLNKFKPIEEKRISYNVLFWGRKNRVEGLKAIKMLPEKISKNFIFIEVSNGITQDEIAKHYQKADIFMALGYPEGFSLPPLEAMASGCAVIGFTGGGGNVHMIHEETALIAEDGNIKQLSMILERVLSDNKIKNKIRNGGIKKAHEFNFSRMENELLYFMNNLKNNSHRESKL